MLFRHRSKLPRRTEFELRLRHNYSELPPGRIVVNRALLGKPPENRTFLINADTKVEGKLKPKARVTVGIKSTDEGDVAVRIIVRTSQSPKKP